MNTISHIRFSPSYSPKDYFESRKPLQRTMKKLNRFSKKNSNIQGSNIARFVEVIPSSS